MKPVTFFIFTILCFSSYSAGDECPEGSITIQDILLAKLGDFQPVNESEVNFFLFDNENNGTQIFKENLPAIDTTKKLKVLIHGWYEHITRKIYMDFVKTYRNKGYNVIGVDWFGPASYKYINSAIYVKSVGGHVANLITELNKNGFSLNDVHIVGHSLGAHVAGFAGKKVFENLSKKVARVTGLDPAGPLFTVPIPLLDSCRLSANDADLVDTVNTDNIFGSTYGLGQTNFFLNWGIGQPGCPIVDLNQVLCGYVDSVFCRHVRSCDYFLESVTKQVSAKELLCVIPPCKTAVFGEAYSGAPKGNFVLYTNNAPPYLK